MKILISGGTGLIGSALTRSLLQNKHQVTTISRRPDKVSSALNPIPWDLARISREMEITDAVINLAGASIAGSSLLSMRWSNRRKMLIKSSRIQAGEAILKAIQRSTHKPEVLIQASAIGYYGNHGKEPAHESASHGNDFLAEVCRDWEDSTSGVEELGVRRIITRMGLVLSREGGLLPLLSLPYKFFLGGPLGDGQQPMSWIHMEDVVHSFQHFMNNPSAQGVYNLTAPLPVNNLAFSTSLAKAMNRPSWIPVPTIAVQLALGEASTLALDGREVFPQRLLESGYEFKFMNIDTALNNLFHS